MTDSLADIEVKATPGEWWIAPSADHGIHSVKAIDPADGRKFEVCEVWGIDSDLVETEASQANAQLIALAPTLATLVLEAREALAEMTAHYVQLAGCGDCGNWDPELEGEVIRARTTLAKLESL